MSSPAAQVASPPQQPVSDQAGQPHKRRERLRRHLPLYLMLALPLLWFAIYKYAPMYGLVIAFKDYKVTQGMLGSPWADPWYGYFEDFFTSPFAGQILLNTLLISVYKIFWGMGTSLLLALVLNECRLRWLGRWAQSLSYMPHFLSWVIIFGITLAFFGEADGLINNVLATFGIDRVGFLTSTDWFRSLLVGSAAWKDLGWGAIIYLAAMSGIDPQRYEAAKVDGAGRLRQIWHVTLPGIRPVFILLLILQIGNIMEAGFEHVYVFYNPLVYEVADIIDTWVYRVGLEQLNFSLAAAAGLFKSVIGLVLVILANRLARRWDGQIW